MREVIGIDLEPAAVADRPGTYARYVTADLEHEPDVLEDIGECSAVVAGSAIGAARIGLDLLTSVVSRTVQPGVLLAFAVARELLPGFLEELAPRVGAREFTTIDYTHRRSTDDSPHHARAVCWQVNPRT